MKHKDLHVWQLGMEIVKDVYRLSGSFPKTEMYGLTSQIRRSAVSVPSNIAEGAARSSQKEFLKFLFIARGSLSELDTQLIIAQELDYFQGDIALIENKMNELFGKINGLIASIKRKIGL